MAKVSDKTAAAPASADTFVYLDASDTTDSAQGTLKRATAAQIAEVDGHVTAPGHALLGAAITGGATSSVAPQAAFSTDLRGYYAIVGAYTTDAEIATINGSGNLAPVGGGNFSNSHGAGEPVVVLPGVVLRPEYFGAAGDYDPDADTGTDDSAAFQAMFDAMGQFSQVQLSAARYLIESGLQTPQIVTIKGEGLASQLWGALTGGTGTLLLLGDGTNNAQPTLKDFAILGRSSPGTHAINAYSITNMDIDIYVGGGWTNCLYCHSSATGTGSGGGMQSGKIRLVQRNANTLFDFSYSVPNPTNGVNNQGWSNGVHYHCDFGTLSGNGIWLQGSYASANTCVITGSFQGISGTAIKVEPMAGVTDTRGPQIRDAYFETNTNDIVIDDAKTFSVEGVLGDVTLNNCDDVYVDILAGVVTVDSDCERVVIRRATSDSAPISNAARDTKVLSWANYNTPGNIRTPGGVNGAGENVLINGDGRRVLGGSDTQWWGWGRFYTATQCGDGLADTTRTNNTPYCVLVEDREGWGSTARYDLWGSDELVGMAGRVFWVSLKAKTTQGIAYLNAIETGGSDANVVRIGDSSSPNAVAVENGFYRTVYLFKITAAMVTSGCSLDLRVPNNGGTETLCYVSEIMAGWGSSAPTGYVAATRLRGGDHIDANGRIVAYASAAPSSGGDTIDGKAWQVGDVVYDTAPTAGGTLGWVCTTAGSPGTWKAFGDIVA